MADRPTAAELSEAVREWLDDEVRPTLEGRLAFHARVAVNALGMVERELLATGHDPELVERVATMTGVEAVDDIDAALVDGIRSGRLGVTPEVISVVRAAVRARLEVANPRYLQ